MDQLVAGKAVYERIREVIVAVRPLVEPDGETRWLLEDLEDALLDLKLAIMDGNRVWTVSHVHECRQLLDELLGEL
jgi:hypothetical protein